jgi:hypothetical protein
LNFRSPKMYGDNLGDAYLLRYNFQGDDLPSSHDGDIFFLFYCSYGKNFPWSDFRRENNMNDLTSDGRQTYLVWKAHMAKLFSRRRSSK